MVINFLELILTGSLEKSQKSQTLEPAIISCHTVYIYIYILIINVQKPKIDQDNTIYLPLCILNLYLAQV